MDVRGGFGGGGQEYYACMKRGRGFCDVSFSHWLIASGERADGGFAQEENMESHEIKIPECFSDIW